MPIAHASPVSLEFRLLGAFEAWRDGRPVRLSGERQRRLLALLLLHANEVVAAEALAAQLFSDAASDGGVNAVRVAVSRLRRLLAGDGDGDGMLETRPGGYLLRLRPEQLDVVRFERLLSDGRELLAAGDPERAAATLREALALWRGPPLADLSTVEFVQPEIRRLEELRLAALSERLDADLALGRDAELIAELEALVAANPLQERLRAQLMLALYRAGRQADALDVYRQTSALLRDELGLEPSRSLAALERAILNQDATLDVAPPATRTEVCPFKGLAFFDRADAEYFFGRERTVADLVARLAESTLVGIIGPSGMGKSSLLRAGVLPALERGALPGSAGWRQLLMRPGEHPPTRLTPLDGSERTVIAVDQLEEAFTVCESESEREAFFAALAAAAQDGDRRALVLVSLRADLYGRCASYPRFAALLSRSHVLVGPMERGELRRAIEEPAQHAGLEVERPLVDALLDDVAGEPGGLPLLSTALLELWRRRDGNTLRRETYAASGGVRGAVARLAEAAFTGLGEAEQAAGRRILLRLAAGEPDAPVRRRVPREDLERVAGGERVLDVLADARLITVSEGEVEVSHEALLREWPRLRGWLEEERVGRRLQAHLAASAREWDARGRDSAELYRGARLAAALDWVSQHPSEVDAVEDDFIVASRAESESEARRQRSANRRLRGLLAGVAALLVLALAAGVIALVKQGTAAREARRALAGQLGAEAVSEPRIDLAMLLAGEAVNVDRTPQTESTLLTTLLRTPAALGTFALPIDARPQDLAVRPGGRTVAVTDNVRSIRFYDPRTHREQRPPLSDRSLPYPPVYSSDGSLMLSYAGGSTEPPFVDVRDAATLRPVARLRFDRRWYEGEPQEAPGSLLITPDRRTVLHVYAMRDPDGPFGAVYADRWTLPGGRLRSSRRVGAGYLAGVSLLAGGKRLAVIDGHGLSELDTRTLRRVRAVPIAPPAGTVEAGDVSPDGRTAAIATTTGSVAFVDLSTGRSRTAQGAHSGPAAKVLWSPDGKVVVTTGNDRNVIVWDPHRAERLDVLSGHGGSVHGAAFAPDGRTLFTSALDGVVFEWDVGSDRRFGRPFRLGPGMPRPSPPDVPGTPPLAVAPDGSRFAARVGTEEVGVFSTRTLRREALLHPGGIVNALAWSPAGTELAIAGMSGRVQLWTLGGGPRLLRSLTGLRSRTGLPEAVQAVAFSPDGSLLAASDLNHNSSPTRPPYGHLAIWRLPSGRLVAPPLDLGDESAALAYSRDGSTLAVGRMDDGRVTILDPATQRVRRTLRTDGSGSVALAFAPDGRLAVGSWDGIVRLWDPSSGRPAGRPVLVAAAPVASLSFAPDGRRFATTGGTDGTTKLWYTDTLQQQGTTLGQETATWGSAAYTPDGRDLIVVHDDGQAAIWPVSVAAWQRQACAVAGRNLTREEWARFVTGRRYAQTCPE